MRIDQGFAELAYSVRRVKVDGIAGSYNQEKNMRRTKFLTVVLLVALAGFAVGCKTAPVHNIADAPVNTSKSVTQNEVKNAIMRAGSGLGWQMKETGPGRLSATLIKRTHKAVLDITYDTKTYSINYKDSSDLNYDGSNIHKYYNNWVLNLDKRISLELNSL